MRTLTIVGNVPLSGEVSIQGDLELGRLIIIAGLLTEGKSCIYNCPRLPGIYELVDVFDEVFFDYKWDRNCLCLDTVGKGQKNTASFYRLQAWTYENKLPILGAMVGLNRSFVLDIASLDYRFKGKLEETLVNLKKLGANFERKNEQLYFYKGSLTGGIIKIVDSDELQTEEVLLVAVKAGGMTKIINPSKTDRICSLVAYLINCGARICWTMNDDLCIAGVDCLKGGTVELQPDIIVAATYLFALAGTKGNGFLRCRATKAMRDLCFTARAYGISAFLFEEGIYIGNSCDFEMGKLSFFNHFLSEYEIKKKNNSNMKYYVRSELEAVICILSGLLFDGQTIIFENGYVDSRFENIYKDLRELGARITGV